MGGWCWWARERSQSAAPVPVPARTPEERRQGLGAAVRGLELVAGGLVGGVAWTISLRAVGAWPSLVVAAPMVWRRVWGLSSATGVSGACSAQAHGWQVRRRGGWSRG